MNNGINILEKTKTNTQITNISPFGFWILYNNAEYFINFSDYPQLLNASIRQLQSFTTDMEGNFHWEELDVDIEREALEKPENYPLMYK